MLGLLLAYLIVSWLTVATIVVLSNTDPSLVNPEAWVRATGGLPAVLNSVVEERSTENE